ncbi:MAG: c-type cytochrome biogenesis protein CcmI [Paracoccaceae bacterium]|nr:c-type cytochrome biogenesis protein CcmI [Paracoccaceae bacterium]
MGFLVFAILITLIVVLALLLAVRGGGRVAQTGAQSDVNVYRDQLRDVDRDLARGVLTEDEAEAVRLEVSRRLLEADRRASEAAAVSAGQFWPAAALIAVVLVGGGYGLYTQIGAPGYPDLPMTKRLADIQDAAANRMGQAEAETRAAPNLPPPPEPDERFLELMDKLRATLEERPDDIRGLSLLAENEARLGNFAAARKAQDRILELQGNEATANDLMMSIDIMVFAAGGYVSPEAEELIRRLLVSNPNSGAAQYYTGLTLAQNGRPDQAFPIWRRLLEEGPANAPWVPVIAEEITGIAAAAGVQYTPPARTPLRGPSAEDMTAAEDMSDEDRQAMIRGMVEGLAARLASDGGTAEEWARLITALGVLGDTERATAILSEAREVFAADASAIETIENAARTAGLSE